MPAPEKKLYRFGVFEVDAESGELRKSGVRMRLPDQPFQVLMILLERQGEVITRADLREKLWPSDTFVDFDHSLNTIINKLREVLNDSASSPRFIETLAKRGYRFLAPVELVVTSSGLQTPQVSSQNSLAGPGAPAASLSAEPEAVHSFLTHPDELPAVSHGYVRGLFLLIQIMYLCFYVATLARISAVEELLDRALGNSWITVILIVSAAIGIPVRLYLLSAASFDIKDLSRKFLRLFPATFVLDELWALAPFLLAGKIGLGLALGVTAALIYVPFAQRTLVLMREQASLKAKSGP